MNTVTPANAAFINGVAMLRRDDDFVLKRRMVVITFHAYPKM